MDDSRIIELYFSRDEAAIIETERTYGKRLGHLSFGILKDSEDAGECVNDTYLRAWNAIPPQKPTFFNAFLAKICRNLCFDRLDYNRANKRNFELVSLTIELENCIPDRLAEAEFGYGEIGDTLTTFLSTLPNDSKLIFMRRYWFCETIAEIAKYYQVSEGKVKTSLHRTRKRLKAYLEAEGICV